MLQSKHRFWQQLIAACFGLFFSVFNLFIGQQLIAMLLGLASTCFIFSAYKQWHQASQDNLGALGWLLCIFCVLYAGHMQGLMSMLFTFPIAIALFFIFDQKKATILNVVMQVALVLIALEHLPPEVAMRYSGALLMTSLFSFVNALLIENQRQHLLLRADTDGLTKALNRHALHMQMQNCLDNFQRYGQPTTMLMIDVDWFKSVNDNYGHLVGDEILKELVSVLGSRLRKNDLVFRYGGEEFAILLPYLLTGEGAKVAESLREIVEQHPFSHDIHITISIGIATIRREDTQQTWVGRADRRLYMAKKRRNDVVNKDLHEVETQDKSY